MTRRSRNKRHRSRRNQTFRGGQQLRVELEAVEFARGHDGFLRGKPEPVFIFAAFAFIDQEPSLLGRGLKRVNVTDPYPSVTKLSSQREIFRAVRPDSYDGPVLILVLAVEMDGGGDVQDLYADLEKPEALSGWTVGDLMPEPLTLSEVVRDRRSTPPSSTAVHLIRDGQYLHERCKSDDWVGASVIVLDGKRRQNDRWRCHVVSRDERNDWTAVVRVRV